VGAGMTHEGGATKDDKLELSVGFMPEGHTLVGYIAYIKMLDRDGEVYWASRDDGLNGMEMLGMAHDMATEYQVDLANSRKDAGEGHG
jgi:hypothetical protein